MGVKFFVFERERDEQTFGTWKRQELVTLVALANNLNVPKKGKKACLGLFSLISFGLSHIGSLTI